MDVMVMLDNKRIGSVENNTYKKTVTKSKHFFRKYNGYGISVSILDELKENGISLVEIKEKDTKDVYSCNLEDYFKFGKPFLYGDDSQLVLSINYFTKQN